VRVALTSFRWPLDPAFVEGRDETTLARALYATPLRTDPVSGAVVPGLCTAWKASPDFRRWTFSCRSAPSIAAALRRVVRLHRAPARWLFGGALRIVTPSASSLVIRLEDPWRRLPYALTAVAAAPRFVPGPFRLVSGSSRRVVVRRPGLTVVFHRLAALTALDEFRRGRLDEAPVPLGDIVATERDPKLGATWVVASSGTPRGFATR
jgi:MarR-like DNA-binding transcriptional regulator SgrR of sgrS sRNA